MTRSPLCASPESLGVSQDEPKPLDREAVARIIDPEAWEETHADDNDEAAAIFAEAWEDALSKADQIIGLTNGASPIGGTSHRLDEGSSVSKSGGSPPTAAKSDGQRKSEGGNA